MRFKAILLSAFALTTLSATAQDKIYKRNGDVIEGKVKEVSPRNITYKKSNNPDGPDYVINRGDVEKIKYDNGSEEYMNGERMSEGRRGGDAKPSRQQLNYGNNTVSLALINFNDEGYGFGLAYERLLDKKGIVAFYLPVNVTFGSLGSNAVYDPYTGTTNYNGLSRSIVQIMPGVKFYPTGNRGRVRYGVGAQLDYETGYKEKEEYVYSGGTVMPYYTIGKADIQKFGIMVNNSLNMYPNPHLFIGIDLGLGLTYINREENLGTKSMMEMGTEQLAQFNFRIGYRF